MASLWALKRRVEPMRSAVVTIRRNRVAAAAASDVLRMVTVLPIRSMTIAAPRRANSTSHTTRQPPGSMEVQRLFHQRTKKGLVPDDFSHEQSLVLDTDKGLVIINSCSHGGAANIINEIKETFPDKHIHALIGGFHLFNKTDEEIREVASRIKETGIDYVCTGHCTKNRAFGILKEELGDKIDMMKVGFEMEF